MTLVKPLSFVLLPLLGLTAGWYLGAHGTAATETDAAVQQAPAPTAGGETRLPGVELADLGGKPVDLRQFEGKPTVVNLWATWCPPCRREMPVLEQAAAENPEVNFVFANQAESADNVQRFLESEGLTLGNVLLDADSSVARHFQARALPTTLFFGADGSVKEVHLGELSTAQLADYLRTMQ